MSRHDERGYKVNSMLSMPGMNLQLRTYRHNVPNEERKLRRDHVLSVSINGRPREAYGYFIRDERKTPQFRLGDIAFIPGGIPIIGCGPGGLQQTLSCRLDYGAFDVLAPFEQDLSEERLLACGDIKAHKLAAMLGRVAWEMRSPGFASETVVDLLIRTAMIDISRHVTHRDARVRSAIGGLSPSQLRHVTDLVESSLHKSPTVADMARACGVSPGHLMRAFRQSTGQTVHDYVQDVRIARAKTMLKESKRSIKEIATALGFANSSSFSVAFRRRCGESPTIYRRL